MNTDMMVDMENNEESRLSRSSQDQINSKSNASLVPDFVPEMNSEQTNHNDVVTQEEKDNLYGNGPGSDSIMVEMNLRDTASCEVNNKATNEFALPTPLSSELKKVKDLKDKAMKSKSDIPERSKTKKVHDDKEIITPESSSINISSFYKEPEWSGLCEADYTFDVLKNGSIIDTVSLSNKPFYLFGRLPSCDVTLEHPSLSRYHAVVQYAAKSTASYEKGWYIYDLDSTHGTWVNKNKISPKLYYRLKVGYIVKFGGSSRLHILQGPAEDEEEESDLTVTEMKAQKEKLQKQAEILRQLEMQEEMRRIQEEQKILEDRGCSWGMGEDAEDTGEGENNFASLVAENESLYIDDPKKALKGFYEREGCDLPDYQFTEVAQGKHKCRLELPVDGPNGEELIAEAVVSGKRKDAVVACALEACRILDRLGLLRSSTHESRKRKQKKWEDDDYYDSDEDTFLDRTGTIEKKRVMRMKKAGKDDPETYETLLEKYNAVTGEIRDIENKLQKAKADSEALASDELDELDAYMVSIKSGVMDTKTRMQLKGNLLKLKGEEQKLRKLVNVVKPPTLPPLKPLGISTTTTPAAVDNLTKKLQLQQKQVKKVTPVRQPQNMELKPDDFEEDEEDDDQLEEKKDESRVRQEEKINIPTEKSSVDKTQNSKKESSSHCAKSLGPAPNMKTQKAVKSMHYQSTASTLGTLKGEKQNTSVGSNFDPDYAMWLPPTEQAGDGHTSLNDKLGY
ncbi:kanadaptin-like [Biomphalaria glabrata]|uniref:Kanadaptin-like n=1 Tax=Biomphalaria glabrata TaxID=6526 RepID=A0A9W2ZVX1_BIOGL|nr:kanadaptin-like [Biomphalaria glabrata]XP_055879099.1 kanadaptin-like [Biomphalaria glabrata]